MLINQASLFYAGRLFGPYAGKWFGAAPDSALNQFGIFSLAYAAAAAAAKPQNYRPAALNGEVLAAIALVGAHESGEVVFDAPVKPGRYPYLCSFPGHCQIGMRGELIGQ